MNEECGAPKPGTCAGYGWHERHGGAACAPCKEAEAERYRLYYEANKEAEAERKRRYYEANKEAVAERHRRYREANKEAVAERHRRYREANKEAEAERDRRYREANKEAVAARSSRRRALKLQASLVTFSTSRLKAVWREADIGPGCVVCGSSTNLHTDHFYPLQPRGDQQPGPHAPWNLVPLCAHHNTSKSNQPPGDFFPPAVFAELEAKLAQIRDEWPDDAI
jgi:5-methylcytosine-specific restriction endonuclease McrA